MKKNAAKHRRSALVTTSPTRKNTSTKSRGATFPIVGIGASAGGLAALGELLSALPAASGMAYVIISHMDATHESMLDTLLAKKSKLSVQRAANGTTVEPDHVYVIQPGTHIDLRAGVLFTTKRADGSPAPQVIDHFFESLATDRGASARGVVLSGIGSDGTQGLKFIRERGGIAFAQDPKTAQFDSMPRSAIESGAVDVVLPPGQIAAELATAHPSRATAAPREIRFRPQRSDIDEILAALFRSSGVDFSQYKLSTLQRRIARRMNQNRLTSLNAYANYLRNNNEEAEILYNESLIHVSGFFRDVAAFHALRRRVLAPLAGARDTAPIRIWVPGCARGEEVYSIGILLLELLDNRANRRRLQLFGTDISATDIDAARQGRFATTALAQLSPSRRKRFFVKAGNSYQICTALRELCVFARHDVGGDPPFSRLDLISCRNLLIYFARPLQDRTVEMFHYALKPDGHLFLGRSESLSGHTRLFAIADKKQRIYARKPAKVLPAILAATSNRLRLVNADDSRSARTHLAAAPQGESKTELRQHVDRLLIERYAPPGFYIDGDLQIVAFFGDVSAYLRPASGQADFHLSKMLSPEVALDIRTAIAAVRKNHRLTRREGLRISAGSNTRIVNLTVEPLARGAKLSRGYLVTFDSPHPVAVPLPDKPLRRRERNQLVRVRKLLTSTREQLQTVIQEQEQSVQELSTAHEELLSSNEELQSSNEELETAKEELQSGNEELTTVNEEMRKRNEELDHLTSELSTLITGLDVPVLNIDKRRMILRFSPAAKAAFGLSDADIGRSFVHMKAPAIEPHLNRLINQVLTQGVAMEREVQDRAGRWCVLHVRPYKSAQQEIEGVHVALLDVDRIKRQALAIVETTRDPIVLLDASMKVVMASPAFCDTFRLKASEAEGRSLLRLAKGMLNVPELRSLLRDILPQQKRFADFRIDFETRGERRIFLLNGQQLFDEGVGTNKVLLVFRDATVRETAAMSELRALTNRLREEKEQVEKRLAHELHDLSNEGFAGINMNIARLTALVSTDPKAAQRGLAEVGAHVSALAQSTHELARFLHPSILDDLGLAKALKAECRAFEKRTGIAVKYSSIPLPRLSDAVTLCLYRVAQEALRNVAEHSEAKHAAVALSRSSARKGIVLVVRDDGVGFQFPQTRSHGGLGLVSIAERVAAVGGTLSVMSKPRAGTTLRISVPPNTAN